MLEADTVLHAEFHGALPRGGQEDFADIDAQPADAEPIRPAAEQLALAAGEVEDLLSRRQPADFAEQHQLQFGERIQDAVLGFGELVVSE